MIELAWKVSHGALLTMDRLLSFCYSLPAACFCGFHLESPEHLFFFFTALSLKAKLIGFSPFFSGLPGFPQLLCYVMVFLVLLVVPRVFVVLLHSLKFFVWSQRNDFRFWPSRVGAVALLAALKA